MKILILGATGMLGHRLLLSLSPHFTVTGTLRGAIPAFLDRDSALYTLKTGVDAYDLASVEAVLADIKPDCVLNCIGVVKQLASAKDPVVSITLNALFPHQLAALCQKYSSRLIHFSTDCIFSGRNGPYRELDPADAEDLYGRSKLLGEVSGPNALTIRTSIIGREFVNPTGLVEWFLAQRGKDIKGYTGALFTGLTTNAMADVIAMLLTDFPDLSGIWQVSSEPISKYDLLSLINDVAGGNVRIERDTVFSCDRRLDSTPFRQKTGWQPLDWPAMIETMLTENREDYDRP